MKNKTFKIIELILLLVSVALGVGIYILVERDETLEAEYKQAVSGYELGKRDIDMFMDASDYLTNEARLAVVTGKREHFDNYVKEIETDKRRDTAISQLKSGGGEELQEVKYLIQAFESSQELAGYELMAMKLRAGADGVLDTMPEVIKNADIFLDGADLYSVDQAVEVVSGEEYAGLKSVIVTKVDACTNLIGHIAESEQQQYISEMNVNREMVKMFTGMIIIILVLAFVCVLCGKAEEPGKKLGNEGFTLMELIIVLAIIAVLVGITAPTYLRYVQKSRDGRAIQNATTFRNTVELSMVGAVVGDFGSIAESDAQQSYQAISSLIEAPDKNNQYAQIAYDAYHSLEVEGQSFEIIALIEDYEVYQVTYKDYDSKMIYVWFSHDPKGTVLNKPEYVNRNNEWLQFKTREGDPWVRDYSNWQGRDICWNGYNNPNAHKLNR